MNREHVHTGIACQLIIAIAFFVRGWFVARLCGGERLPLMPSRPLLTGVHCKHQAKATGVIYSWAFVTPALSVKSHVTRMHSRED